MALASSFLKTGGRFGFLRVSQVKRQSIQLKTTGTSTGMPSPKVEMEQPLGSKKASSQSATTVGKDNNQRRAHSTDNIVSKNDPPTPVRQPIQEQVARMSVAQAQTQPQAQGQAHFSVQPQQPHPKPPPKAPPVSNPGSERKEDVYFLPHKHWNFGQMQGISASHHKVEGIIDRMAYKTSQFFRGIVDNLAGYDPCPSERRAKQPELMWPKRFLLLECLSSVSPMAAARIQSLKSVYKTEIDNGWVRAMACEADNERMHLLTALRVCHSSRSTCAGILALQALLYPAAYFGYLLSPTYCHRLNGYLQEENIKVYTQCLEDIEEGSMKMWRTQPAPIIAKRYWMLKEDASVYDVIMAIRADADRSRAVNHILACTRRAEFLDPYRLPN